MTARLVEECGVCGSPNLEPVLSLGSSPPTCVMAKVGERPASEDNHPLDLLRCHECSLVQLSVIVDPEIVFPLDYPYSSGNSKALHDNFENLAYEANSWAGGLLSDDLVVDIGANDGTLLSKFTGCRTIGVEPTMQAHRITGGAFYRAFFNEALAEQMLAEHGPAKVITACNVLAHVKDLGSVMRGIELLLADDGVLIAENHDLASVVDGGQWDTVYHEHLRFYSPHSFHRLLETQGLRTMTWREIPTHGGSFRMLAGKSNKGKRTIPPAREYNFGRLAEDAAKARTGIRYATHGAWGIGATARATTIINYCGLDVDDVPAICEVAGSDKIGRYIPGTRIPVVDEAQLFEEQPARVVLFSWHLADSIVPKLRAAGYDGTIIVPLPKVQCLHTEKKWMRREPLTRF